MKKTSLLLMAVIMTMSCAKKNALDGPLTDQWNGYERFLKLGEQVHTLWAGQNINIGTVTYGIDENANFYATYDCSASGWLISESHLFAGDKMLMPLNKPGSPKVGRFPYSSVHEPRVSSVTYRVPLSQLPPYAAPGFVVAAHAVVHSPYSQTETAWAEGDYTFSDKGWGWYDDFYYNNPPFCNVILYGTVMTSDTLKLYLLDLANGTSNLILKEYVGNAPGNYDGAAYDTESGIFLFTDYNTGELWVNDMQGEGSSFSAGTLGGTSTSGTFYDGAYYYVEDELNRIVRVLFTENWNIQGEVILDTIPVTVNVNDIAMSPYGDNLYMIGEVNGSGTAVICWVVNTREFYTATLPIGQGAQIAFGCDDELYAIAPLDSGNTNSQVYIIELDSLEMEVINAGSTWITIEDQFSDLTMGPAW
jgi:hypothetical protein